MPTLCKNVGNDEGCALGCRILPFQGMDCNHLLWVLLALPEVSFRAQRLQPNKKGALG
jgi:hypothetical protein